MWTLSWIIGGEQKVLLYRELWYIYVYLFSFFPLNTIFILPCKLVRFRTCKVHYSFMAIVCRFVNRRSHYDIYMNIVHDQLLQCMMNTSNERFAEVVIYLGMLGMCNTYWVLRKLS